MDIQIPGYRQCPHSRWQDTPPDLGRDLIGCQAGPEIDVIGAFVNGWHPAANPVHVVCIGIFVVPRKTGFSLLIRVMPG